jgi:hypothetical protein
MLAALAGAGLFALRERSRSLSYVRPLLSIPTTTNTPEHVTLPQPYEELRPHLTTAEGAEVIALDRIDAGSAGALQRGASITGTYWSDRPRDARVVGARRSYAVRNAGIYGIGQASVVAVLATLVAGALYVSARQVRRRAEDRR